MAFVEEKNTPKNLISVLCNIFSPRQIINSIINTLKKLYLKENNKEEKDYTQIKFDREVCEYFEEIYLKDVEFCSQPEFELANRMYQFIKILSVVHNKKEAINVLDSISKNDLNLIEKLHVEMKEIDDEKYQSYFLNKFFEKIIRSVPIQYEGEVTLVLFTLHPLVQYLSLGTREQFYYSVNRESVYTKIIAMMEYSSYFYEEIIYNFQKSQHNLLLKILNQINYNFIELMLFVVTVVINFIIISTHVRNENDKLVIGTQIQFSIDSLSALSLILNTITVMIWIYSKYPLYKIIETQKYKFKIRIQRDSQQQELTMIDLIKINLVKSLIIKTEIVFYFFNILINSIGLYSEDFNFVYSIQMLGMLNLNETLKNIIRAISFRYRQLSFVLIFLLLSLFIFAFIHFLFSNSLMNTQINDVQENLCESLIYCFLSMINLGLRTDGGIGRNISVTSFNVNKEEYISLFIFILIFFIVINLVIVSMLLGIIFDTFGEFREKAQEKEDDMLNVCFICEKRRETLEKEGINFNNHIKHDHNLDYYFEYLIGLKFVDEQETNSINSYVLNMIKERQISWFLQINLIKMMKRIKARKD